MRLTYHVHLVNHCLAFGAETHSSLAGMTKRQCISKVDYANLQKKKKKKFYLPSLVSIALLV